MVVAIVVAVAVAVAMALDAGFSPSVKPEAAPAEAAAVVAAEMRAAVEVVEAAPRGLIMKGRPPAADIVTAAEVLGARAGAAPNVNPVVVAAAVAGAGAAAVAIGEAKRDGPRAGVACVAAGGAGVVDGLIPKGIPTA